MSCIVEDAKTLHPRHKRDIGPSNFQVCAPDARIHLKSLQRNRSWLGSLLHTGLGRAPDPGSSPPPSPLQSTESVTGAVAGTSGNDKPRRSSSSVIADLSGLSWSAVPDGSAVKERYCSSISSSDQSSIGRSRLSSTLPPSRRYLRLPAKVSPEPAKEVSSMWRSCLVLRTERMTGERCSVMP